MTPELSRPERVDAIGAGARRVTISAQPEERAALARRFGLIAVDRLEAAFDIRREAAGIAASGTVSADVVQRCSVTDDPLAVTIDEPVTLRFVADDAAAAAEEIELDVETCDTIAYGGGAIDLGEAAAETMALALDPFPRGPNAERVLREAGVLREEDAMPGGALAGLRALLNPRRDQD